MKTKKFFFAVLVTLSFIAASLTSSANSSGFSSNNNWKSADTTDSNPGGLQIPPIGR